MLLNSTMTKQSKNTNFLPVFIDDSLRTHKIFLYIVLKSHAKRFTNLQTSELQPK